MASSVTAASPAGSAGARSRLPRWTRREILVLVQGKTAHERGEVSAGGKWEAVSAYCMGRGVERGPLQCRKRWSNLACDFKKVRRWGPSFWEMRSDARRERRLPGFFDREVYALMEGRVIAGREEEEGVFDNGRPAVAGAHASTFFSDGEEEDNDTGEDTPLLVTPLSATAQNCREQKCRGSESLEKISKYKIKDGILALLISFRTKRRKIITLERIPLCSSITPLSEKKYEPFKNDQHSDPGNSNKQQENNHPEKVSSSWEGQKRRRMSEENYEKINVESKLIEALEKNTKMISEHLEAHNLSCQLDREQRKDQFDGLLVVLTKLADAVGKIADKLRS